ncbi:MAG: GyrI-like domain-containing protein [Acidimicrobiales bacterium]
MDGDAAFAATLVSRDETPELFLRTADDAAAFAPLWGRLETLVGLRGRRFFGAFFVSRHEYWVCVEAAPDLDAGALGLEEGTLPAGRYLRVRLRGEPPAIYERIGPTFESMAVAATPDPTRPGLEFYRSRDAIDCLLPVDAPDT